MKLLITGFRPFGNVKVNPSWEVAKRIALVHPAGVEVCARRLPVVFDGVGDVLWEAVEQFAPDVVLMLGVATKRSVISYERVAINIDDSSKVDNEGKTYPGTPYGTMVQQLISQHFPSRKCVTPPSQPDLPQKFRTLPAHTYATTRCMNVFIA